MSFVDQQLILDKTNGGLDIILRYYPDAHKCVDNKNAKFKIRTTEKTASCTLKQLKDSGVWVVTDWGDDQKSRNGIEVIRKEEGVDFKTALAIAARDFGIEEGNHVTANLPKAEFEKRGAKPDEKEGDYSFDLYQEIPGEWLKTLGPYVKDVHCQYLHFYACKSFTYIKDRQALITKSTDEYPIFIIDEGEFKKIYQPKNPDKQFRFRYQGTKPKDFVHGLQQARNKYEKLYQEYLNSNDTEDGKQKQKEPKLPEIILCSGDRDAINVMSMGYDVIWLNSESAKLSAEQYKDIMKCCFEFYNLPDIDSTGIKQGTEQALKWLDMKTIWLPEELKEKRDFRGNPCKDIRDYLDHWKPKHFKELIKVALPARAWDEIYTENKLDFKFNNVQAYYFFKLNGFFRFKNRNEKSGFIYIRLKNNIVEEIDANEIKNFINVFLEDRKLPISLRNRFYTTNQLAETSLSNLPSREIDFADFDKNTQYLFYSNHTWKVTRDKIEEYRPGEMEKFVWADEVIPHRVKKMDDFFTIEKIEFEEGQPEYDIKIHNQDCLFFRYLINTSRVHWRKELEDYVETLKPEEAAKYRKENAFNIAGPGLDEEEHHEQKLHLINKMYSLGYLLHRYKEPSRPWCVFAMDNKISDEGESHGGSGKSIAYNALRIFMKSVTLNGRNKKLTDNQHIYENVTEHTDYILIDDANKWIDFSFFFKALTNDLDVNPKNNKQYSIPFENAPKFCITSNYTLPNIDPSTERRLIYTVFSDYYHFNSNGEYNEHRDPTTDFGKNLFNDFTDDEWNLFHNFMAQCLKLYLNHSKIDPPMENVNKRNLQTIMTDSFRNWGDMYFAEDNGNVNVLIAKKKAFEDFKEETKNNKFTINRFTRSLKAWCKYNHHILDPQELRNSQDRIIRKQDGTATEMVYVQTTEKVVQDEEERRADF
jgi:hypothetical protein